MCYTCIAQQRSLSAAAQPQLIAAAAAAASAAAAARCRSPHHHLAQCLFDFGRAMTMRVTHTSFFHWF
jgi:hypothetical protein